jgi:hypothetical protein
MPTTASPPKRPRARTAVRAPKRPAPPTAPELRFPDDTGADRETIEPGETLDVEASGLKPGRTYTLSVRNGETRMLFTSTLLTDATGSIERTSLWPQAGLEDPRGRKRATVEQAMERSRGRRLLVTLSEERRELARRTIGFSDRPSRPILVSIDEHGMLQNAVDPDREDAHVAGFHLPVQQSVRVYLVRAQQVWQAGDAFTPVILATGRPAMADAQVDEQGRLRTRICRCQQLEPGAYDFILRPLRYGYEDDEDFQLRMNDLVTRRLTGLVVRGDFMARKAVRGGCANTMPISGRTVGGQPYFQYSDTFQLGENIYGALDPLALSPSLVGKMVALYLIQHKTAAQWTANNGLTHLPALGGNPAVQKFLTQPGCINFNKRLLWANASQVGEYDIIADFGNDTADPMAFVTDAQFNMPNDICDGYFTAGFRVVPDPATDTSFANAGSFTSNDGPVTIADDFGQQVTVPRQARVYFPADVPGATTPAQISAAQAAYPMLIIVHGNSSAVTSYLGYDYLLEHWARNGFIAASVHCNVGMYATGRARVLFEHIGLLETKFGAKAQNNIGIMGHSRGGEAVLAALRLNFNEGLGHNFAGVICLAPSDWILHETMQPAWARPLQVIYGSMDGDIAGGPPLPMETGFAIYDRASGAAKSAVFAYGAIHDRFNTIWGDGDLGFGKLGGSDLAKLISADAHQKIAKGYMTAFFRRHLRAEAQWDGIFTGEWRPAAVEAADAGAVRTYHQFTGVAGRQVDTFEGAHTPTSWQTSTIGGVVSDDSTLPAPPVEDNLWSVDGSSPHATAGLLCRWNDATDHLRFELPAGQRDVSGFTVLSFRVTQKNASPSNPVGLPQDLYVTLKSGNGKSRSIRAAAFGQIPYPDQRFFSQYTKSAMTTVRIPLPSYTIAVINTVPVDLTDVTTVTFDFAVKSAGEIEVDSVEFGN